MANSRAYSEVSALLESVGGQMEFSPGGGPGGVWRLALRGRVREVPVRDHRVNALDDLYVPNCERPQTWDDYDRPYLLRDDAFWRLVKLFSQSETPQ